MTIGGVEVPLGLHLEVAALCVGLLAAYFRALQIHGPVMVEGVGRPAATRLQKTAFTAGVLTLWIASGSPLHDIADGYLFSAHMLQHLLQAFVAPPLLLIGTPSWMFELVTKNDRVRSAVRSLGAPIVATLLFNTILMLIHWPQVVTLMVDNGAVHFAAHAAIVLTGLVLWLPVLSPSTAVVPRLSLPGQMLYLVAQTILPTVPSSFLTFGDTPLYTVYERFPRLWGIGALDDMQAAGIIMKIGGGFYLWGIITVLFFKWAGDEERHGRNIPPRLTSNPHNVPTS